MVPFHGDHGDNIMKRVILHAGLGKTGTTTIQATLAHHRHALAGLGVAYPGRDEAHHDLIGAIHQLGPEHYWFTTRHIAPDDAIAAGQRQMRAIGDMAGQDVPLIVLSSELFQTLNAAQLASFDADIAGLGYQLETVIFVRDPYPWYASFIQQSVKQGSARIDDMLGRGYRHLSVVQLRAALRALGRDRVHVLRMEEAVGQGLTRALLTAGGVSLPTGKIPDLRRNIGICRQAVYLFDAIRAVDDDAQSLRQKHLSRLLTMEGDRFTLPPDIAANIAPRVAEEQAWLQRRIGFSYPSDPPIDGPTHGELCAWAQDELPRFLSRRRRVGQGWLRRSPARSG